MNPKKRRSRKVASIADHPGFRLAEHARPGVETLGPHHFRCEACGHEWKPVPRIDDPVERARIPVCPKCEPETETIDGL
jgi:hypothetical protein